MSIYIQLFIFIFFGFIFVTLLMNVVNPRFLWKTFESWKATSEPSKSYFRIRRISSFIGLIIISLIMAGPTILYWLDK